MSDWLRRAADMAAERERQAWRDLEDARAARAAAYAALIAAERAHKEAQ